MTLPHKLTKFTTQSPINITYSYSDINIGVGTTVFYCQRSASTAETYHLITTTEKGVQDTDGSGGIRFRSNSGEKDFDFIEYQLQQTIKGTAFLGGLFTRVANGSIRITLKKFDGSIETSISSEATSPTFTASGQFFIPIPLTETVFKRGDLLRASITITGASNYVGLDPSGVSEEPLKLIVPFNLNL